MKIRLAALDGDAEYLRLLKQYIRQSDFSHKFALKTFSDSAGLMRYLFEQAGKEETDILLAAPPLLADETCASFSFPVVKLQENPYLLGRENGCDAYKYQPLNQLLAKLISLHMQRYQPPEIRSPGQRRGQVVSVFSASGGCGKTTIAYSLARQMVLFEQRVLYVSLESLPTTNLLFPEYNREANDDFARFMYCLKAKPEQLGMQLPSYASCDPITQIHYIGSAEETKEMSDMNREDAIRLIQELSAGKVYDIILLDLESVCHERIAGALQACDRILWIVNDDVRCLHKTEKWFQSGALFPNATSILGKTHFILNKRYGDTVNDFSAKNMQIEEQLPFVKEWQAVQSCRRLLYSSDFNERLVKLSHRLDFIGKEVQA